MGQIWEEFCGAELEICGSDLGRIPWSEPGIYGFILGSSLWV